MSSGCIGRMSFPYPSIRREASVTCGTPNTGRCKQTPYRRENKCMKIDVQMWKSVPKVLGVEKPSPLAPAERCPHRADPLASFAGSHVRVTQAGWLKYKPCWFRRPAVEVEVSAEIGSCEGYRESLSHPLPHFWALLAMVGMSGLEELRLPLHLSSPVCLSVSKCVLCIGTTVL